MSKAVDQKIGKIRKYLLMINLLKKKQNLLQKKVNIIKVFRIIEEETICKINSFGLKKRLKKINNLKLEKVEFSKAKY